ncbi:hypothetical protein PssvBMR1_gp01 [Pseudomonas phage MR1]|uniref:Uncharacterized protein n=1 Tax=Pseudomonas phage MR1 TaxID=2711169 RepID=A0A6M3T8N1_9CAUD|nr:hypothetical protein PssvBMR1_gp01 [Pseudomonas phage MR1]
MMIYRLWLSLVYESIDNHVLTVYQLSVEWSTSETQRPTGLADLPRGLVVTDQRSHGCQRSQGDEH